MKLATMITIAAAMAVAGNVNASAKEKSKDETSTGRQVTVYRTAHSAVPYRIEGAAMDQASEMFADIGVSLVWRFGSPSRPEARSIAIEIVTGPPAKFMPGTLAYAFPYEGLHIRVFWDRIRGYATPREVLAHVMVHEITHILEGEPRHSAEGIMKAHWTAADVSAMARKPLGFAPEDIKLIFEGLDRRETDPAVTGPGAATTSAIKTDAPGK
jgi:hypothetical protein